MQPRPLEVRSDVGLLQRFTAEQIKEHGRSGFLHPGDIPHRIFNGLRRENPADLVHIWEEDDGVIAWALLDPRGAGFDLQVASSTDSDLERDFLVWSEETLIELMRTAGSASRYIETDAFADDSARCGLLRSMGWVAIDDEVLVLTRRRIDKVSPPELPEGYSLRTVSGVEEAAAVAELHAAGFGSSWTPELYRRVMESPGYSPDRELLVEAPDGTLAAFCVIWPDEINQTGYFEPVAVHPAHRRLGLGRALMRAGMQAMQDWGMEHAEVMFEEGNPGSGKLYLGEGFEPIWELSLFRKPFSP